MPPDPVEAGCTAIVSYHVKRAAVRDVLFQRLCLWRCTVEALPVFLSFYGGFLFPFVFICNNNNSLLLQPFAFLSPFFVLYYCAAEKYFILTLFFVPNSLKVRQNIYCPLLQPLTFSCMVKHELHIYFYSEIQAFIVYSLNVYI